LTVETRVEKTAEMTGEHWADVTAELKVEQTAVSSAGW
jgi:hypothetical protein